MMTTIAPDFAARLRADLRARGPPMSAPAAPGADLHRLVLASASPRRRELLERVGFTLDVRPADIDETERPGEAPAAYVARVARGKADAVSRPPGAWVLAADTTVTIDGAILGKAATPEEAAAMLRRLSGRAPGDDRLLDRGPGRTAAQAAAGATRW